MKFLQVVRAILTAVLHFVKNNKVIRKGFIYKKIVCAFGGNSDAEDVLGLVKHEDKLEDNPAVLEALDELLDNDGADNF